MLRFTHLRPQCSCFFNSDMLNISSFMKPDETCQRRTAHTLVMLPHPLQSDQVMEVVSGLWANKQITHWYKYRLEPLNLYTCTLHTHIYELYTAIFESRIKLFLPQQAEKYQVYFFFVWWKLSTSTNSSTRDHFQA